MTFPSNSLLATEEVAKMGSWDGKRAGHLMTSPLTLRRESVTFPSENRDQRPRVDRNVSEIRFSPFLSTHEVAVLLRCSTRTIHELTRSRRIPHRRPPGTRRCLFLKEEIELWLDGASLEVLELASDGRAVTVEADRPARTPGSTRVSIRRRPCGHGHGIANPIVISSHAHLRKPGSRSLIAN